MKWRGRNCLSIRLRDRRYQMFGKGLAAPHRIPCAAFQITAADQGMDGKTCLVRAAPMIPPLCSNGRGKVWVLRDAVDNLLRRASAPFVDGPVVPPFNHLACKVGHGAGRKQLVHRFPPFPKRGDPCLDHFGLIGKPIFQIALLGLKGARQRRWRGVCKMQVVIDGPHGFEFHGRVR